MKINVKVKPNARRREVKQISADLFEVAVIATPTEGRANQAVIEILAEHFRTNRRSVKISRGFNSKFKFVDVEL